MIKGGVLMGNRGMHFYHKGSVTKMFKDGEEVPEGWEPGMAPQSEEARELRRARREETCLRVYGKKSASQSVEVKVKSEETCRKRYGYKCSSQAPEIKEKARNTCKGLYGGPGPMCSSEVRAKAEATNLKKRGVRNAAQSKEVQEKMYQTNLRRHGKGYYFQTKEFLEKAKKTNQEHLKVDWPMQSSEVQEKSRQTCRRKYEVDYYFQSSDAKVKTRKFYQEHYGTNCYAQTDEFKKKFEKASIRNWGTKHPAKSEEVKKRMRETNQERYHVDYFLQIKGFHDIYRDAIMEANMKHWGVPWYVMSEECKGTGHGQNSQPNKQFDEMLSLHGVNHEREFPLGEFIYDFKAGNILVEIDPWVTHNSLWSPWDREDRKKRRSPDYHQKKSRFAESMGYRVIHVWDWDDTEKVVTELLIPRKTLNIRECHVQEVPIEDAEHFLSEHCLSKPCSPPEACIGLYRGGTLVSAMAFKRARPGDNGAWEVLGHCSTIDIPGGAGALLNYFSKHHGPDSVAAYCDRSKFTGKGFQGMGMRLVQRGEPRAHWYNPKSHELLEEPNATTGGGIEGFYPVFDCGIDSYLWTREGSSREG